MCIPAPSPFRDEQQFWLGQSETAWEHVSNLYPEPAIMERTFIARAEKETNLVMAMVPMTYVYGILQAPPSSFATAGGVWVDYPLQRRGAHFRTWTDSGQYLAGPSRQANSL